MDDNDALRRPAQPGAGADTPTRHRGQHMGNGGRCTVHPKRHRPAARSGTRDSPAGRPGAPRTRPTTRSRTSTSTLEEDTRVTLAWVREAGPVDGIQHATSRRPGTTAAVGPGDRAGPRTAMGRRGGTARTSALLARQQEHLIAAGQRDQTAAAAADTARRAQAGRRPARGSGCCRHHLQQVRDGLPGSSRSVGRHSA